MFLQGYVANAIRTLSPGVVVLAFYLFTSNDVNFFFNYDL